jgi:ubiquinone/menaquinone biosynthesis C-methylase UbiE
MKIDYDSLAQEYALHRQIQPEVLKNLVQIGGLNNTSRVLDVGCGTGNYTVALETATGCSCWAIEPSEQMLAKARQRTQIAHFKQGQAERLDYSPEFFDLVFSVDIIHHVGDRSAHFHEAYQVLKKGGKVCTVTDSEEIIYRRQPLSVYFPETIGIELQRYPRISDLRTLMVEAGFSDLQEVLAEFPYTLTNIESYRGKAFSSLHLISSEAFEQGLRHMEQDLLAGPIPCISRYLLLWGTK